MKTILHQGPLQYYKLLTAAHSVMLLFLLYMMLMYSEFTGFKLDVIMCFSKKLDYKLWILLIVYVNLIYLFLNYKVYRDLERWIIYKECAFIESVTQ